ncbi:transporter substrate-binding domain-containing protein [Clostridium guangxiense]|uniref:transporter substrate-binding domain-containing protein n=2 Tax=Clostridium TaxID=1485 RepID=UPI0038B2BD71
MYLVYFYGLNSVSDLANELGKKMGIKIKFVSNAWDGIFLALNSKKFDVIMSTVSITNERKKTMLFLISKMKEFQQ